MKRLVISLVLFGVASPTYALEKATTPQAAVAAFVGAVFQSMKMPKAEQLNGNTTSQGLCALEDALVDVSWVAQAVLPHSPDVWKAATDADRAAYVAAAKSHLANLIAQTFSQYTQDVSLIKFGEPTRAPEAGAVGIDVKIPDVDYPVTAVVMQQTDQSYKIIDVIKEGVSMLEMKRSDFHSTAVKGLPALTSALNRVSGNMYGLCR